jgi:hypothetical protein
MRHLFILVLLVPGLQGCTGSGCDNVVSKVATSPSGSHSAVVFSRECGATSGFSTQVSVIRGGSRLPDDGGNTLILGDQVEVGLTWSGDGDLIIAYSSSSEAFRKESMVAGVGVRYVPHAL